MADARVFRRGVVAGSSSGGVKSSVRLPTPAKPPGARPRTLPRPPTPPGAPQPTPAKRVVSKRSRELVDVEPIPAEIPTRLLEHVGTRAHLRIYWGEDCPNSYGRGNVGKGGRTCAAGAGSILTDYYHGHLVGSVLKKC